MRKESISFRRYLDKEEVRKVAECLATSFQGYPLFEYFSKKKYSIKKMTTFWEVMLKVGMRDSIKFSDLDMKSILIAVEPNNRKEHTVVEYLKAGGVKLLFLFGIEGIKRMIDFEKRAIEIQRNVCSDREAWYLYALVTHPDYRQKNLSRRLLSELFDVADDGKVDIYLETLLLPNVGIYNKYNFELISETPYEGMTIYSMLRKSRDNI